MNKNIYGENIKEYTIKLVIFKGDFDFRIDLFLNCIQIIWKNSRRMRIQATVIQ